MLSSFNETNFKFIFRISLNCWKQDRQGNMKAKDIYIRQSEMEMESINILKQKTEVHSIEERSSFSLSKLLQVREDSEKQLSSQYNSK